MKGLQTATFVLLLVLLAVLPACDSSVVPATPTPVVPTAIPPPPASPSSTLAAPPTTSHLLDALTVVPTSTATLAFTDWSLIKEYERFTSLPDKSDKNALYQLFTTLAKNQYSASSNGLLYLGDHAATWSWDFTDLDWEATIKNINAQNPDAKPVAVFKFRDDFDLAPVLAHFDQYGFQQSTYAGMPIYSHAQAPGSTWFDADDLNVLNTAVVADAKLLISSQSLEGVQRLLAAYQGQTPAWANYPLVVATVAHLGQVASALVSPAYPACDYSGVPSARTTCSNCRITAEGQATFTALAPLQAKLRQYSVFGVGYRYEEKHPLGLVAFQYANASDAKADLLQRQDLATNGVSLLTKGGGRYQDGFFTLDSATIDDTDLLLRLHPVNDQPKNVLSLADSHDFMLALCPAP